MTAPTPEPTTDPTPEAELVASGINLACALSLCCRDGTKDRAVVMDRPEAIKNIARALDSFAQAAVERERERLGNCPKCGSEGYGYEDDDNVESCIDCGHRGKL